MAVRSLGLATQISDCPCGLRFSGSSRVYCNHGEAFPHYQGDKCLQRYPHWGETATFSAASLTVYPEKQCHTGSSWLTVSQMSLRDLNQHRAGEGNGEKKNRRKGIIPFLWWGGLLLALCPHVKYPLINFVLITECRETRPLLIYVALIYASENYTG